MKIGYVLDTYAEKRLFINLIKKKDVEYVPFLRNKKTVYRVKNVLGNLGVLNWNFHLIYRNKHKLPVDVVHTFNTVCDIQNPWCVTFESTMPRLSNLMSREWEHEPEFAIDEGTRKIFELIKGQNCLGIIPFSESAYNIQMNMLDKLQISDADLIKKKMTIVHPPQQVLISEKEIIEKNKKIQDEVKFIFIANDFFRKGGPQVVKALQKWIGKIPLSLTLISTLNYGDFASGATRQDRDFWEKYIENAPWIHWIHQRKGLKNSEVLNLCREAHIGLMPSMADTYGYVVLEMQACGCTVLTTDIRALPEINNEDCGWICHVPKNEMGEAYYRTEEQKEKLKIVLEEEVQRNINDIMVNLDKVCDKALESVRRINIDHNPEKIGQKLYEIYRRANCE